MIVSGFIEPIVRELPLEYAVEMNRLIQRHGERVLRTAALAGPAGTVYGAAGRHATA
jgi:hypothetical protein